ncbi:hypothetical protein [Corynebacterium renale]|uniref:hypothetical protein n=1 Tax=Corynebacterium renale TaxID=1724 RepID=UPI000E08A736|nr:hypothetical protein [Corynebacterium renale]STC97743.1 Uncharacterised protein [Corynebacterium renale]STD70261.1 Uncharacterised protein [Corynebacterium renale]
MSLENWISTIAATIAFASFLASLWQARLARKSEELSAESASRSASAAESASSSQERIAKALEALESRYSNPWRVEHFHGSKYILRNDSDETALEVVFETDSLESKGERYECGTMGPGDEIPFLYIATMGTDRLISVQWVRPSESEPRVWNGTVPRRPSK